MDQLFCLPNVRELRLSRESNHLMSLLSRRIQKNTKLKLKPSFVLLSANQQNWLKLLRLWCMRCYQVWKKDRDNTGGSVYCIIDGVFYLGAWLGVTPGLVGFSGNSWNRHGGKKKMGEGDWNENKRQCRSWGISKVLDGCSEWDHSFCNTRKRNRGFRLKSWSKILLLYCWVGWVEMWQ